MVNRPLIRTWFLGGYLGVWVVQSGSYSQLSVLSKFWLKVLVGRGKKRGIGSGLSKPFGERRQDGPGRCKIGEGTTENWGAAWRPGSLSIGGSLPSLCFFWLAANFT